MNRPGQPQQRPPNLGQNASLASQFRPPFPAYGLPPRNVNPLLPSSGYASGLQPSSHRAPPTAQQSQVPTLNPNFMQQRTQGGYGFGSGIGQNQSSTTVPQQASSHQPQQTNGSSTTLPLHLSQTSNLGTSSLSSSDVGLDPNDFPALGSTTANSASGNTNGTSAGTTSYATQAGTGLSLGGSGIGVGATSQARDFTQDDFPVLGGQSGPSTNLNAPHGAPSPYSQQSQVGTNSLAGQPQYPTNGVAGDAHSNSNPTKPNNLTTHHNPTTQPTATLPRTQSHPQTPAQQVLVSAADRWGLLGLLAVLKNVGPDLDQGMIGIGTDLGAMGLDMSCQGNLYSTFITPWADQSAARAIEPEFHLPQCYLNVHTQPPGPNKATAFSDETLFFMFYTTPRDALQEIAAQELWNRNWRYHKDLRLWITKESGMTPSQKVQGGEQGQYTYWDPENWTKERKEMTVLYTDLEEKTAPAFVQGPGLVLATTTGQSSHPVWQQHQSPIGASQTQSQRGSFQMSTPGL